MNPENAGILAMNFNFPQDDEVNKYMGYDIVSLMLSAFTAQNGQNVTQGHAPPWIWEVLLICPVISKAKIVDKYIQNMVKDSFVSVTQRLFPVKYCLEFSITWGRLRISRWLFHSCVPYDFIFTFHFPS